MSFVDAISQGLMNGRYGRNVKGAMFLYQHHDQDYLLHNNNLVSWLYDEPWSEEKWRQYALLSRFPGIGDYMDYLLDYRATQEYFRRHNMDWFDIHDPRKLSVTQSYGRMISSVSSNINELYR